MYFDNPGQSKGFEYLNPWTHIWFRPRAVIAQLIRVENDVWVTWIPALVGLLYSIPSGAPVLTFNKVLGIIACLSGLFLGPGIVILLGKLLKWTGSWFGGKGEAEELRTVIAWAQSPLLSALGMALILLLIQWKIPSLNVATNVVMILLVPILMIETFIIQLVGISEVHHFSKAQSFFSMIFAYFFLSILTTILAGILAVAIIFFPKSNQQSPNSPAVSEANQILFGENSVFHGKEGEVSDEVVQGFEKLFGVAMEGTGGAKKSAQTEPEEKMSITTDEWIKQLEEKSTRLRQKHEDRMAKKAKQESNESLREPAPTSLSTLEPVNQEFRAGSLRSYTGSLDLQMKDGVHHSGTLLSVEGRDLVLETARGTQIFNEANIESVEKS